MSANIVRKDNLQELLTMWRPSFEEMAKVHNAVNFRQEASFALQILQSSDYVMKAAMADQDAFKRAIINIAGIGLTLNPAHGLAYLIPRKNKITYDVSYKGKIALAVDVGSIKWCQPELVYSHDKFKFKGVGKMPLHDFDPFLDDRGELRGGYGVAKTHSNEYVISYMSMKQIYAIRSKSEAWQAGKGGNPWKSDEVEMIKKTLIRRNSKLWPFTSTRDRARLDAAIALEEEQDPLPEIESIDQNKSVEKIATIKSLLLQANIDEEYYLSEKLPEIIRRKIDSFEGLTSIEIDQITVQLSQIAEGK